MNHCAPRPSLVPTLRVGTPVRTLRVPPRADALSPSTQHRGAVGRTFPRGAWERGLRRRACAAVLALLGMWLSVASAQAQLSRFFKDPSAEYLRSNPTFLKAFREVVTKPSESTVRVQCDGRDTALGVVVGPDGWILTKANDLKGDIAVKLRNGKTYEARWVGTHQEHDVALLKIEASGLKPIVFTDSKKVSTGSWIACAGTGEEPVAIGVVSVGTRSLKGAMNFMTADLTKAGYLGVALEPGEGHPRIMRVEQGTPAAKIGLRDKDLILTLNGAAITEVEQFINEIGKHKPGDTVTIKVRRGDVELDLKPTLDRRPFGSMRGEFQNRMGSELSSRRGGYSTILQHDSVVKPADCGGPIVDLEGRVIGINICRAGRTESFAVPAEAIEPILLDLMAGKLPPKQDVAKLTLEQQMAAARKALKKAEDEKARIEKKVAESKTILARLEAEAKAAPQIDRLVALMQQRLTLMKDVAGAKWQAQELNADPKREAELLDQLVTQGQKVGLSADVVRGFFIAQFDASKQVQQMLFDRWRKESAELKDVPDLQKDLRPKIEQVSQDLLTVLAQLQPHLANPDVQQRLRDRAAAVLTGDLITDAVRTRALEPLIKR
jgi:serine protease Do